MLKSDFYYTLPPELIAQTPVEPRDASRLLCANRLNGSIKHDRFINICNYLKSGDLLVLNDSKVFPARLYGIKRGSGIDVEFLLLEQKKDGVWETMTRPGRRLKKGAVVDFSESLSAEIIGEADGGNRIARFNCNGDFFDTLNKIGRMPLPPYITEKLNDNERYNTIYSSNIGSSAAPTAGLHFTDEVFKKLAQKGIDTAFVTLHVGLGTFRPVKVNDISAHKMHSEHFFLPQITADKINKCKKNGGRIIATGTTSCRTLESVAALSDVNANGAITEMSGCTDIFIRPGYNFKIIDGLITNFHLPESTLIMLVCSFLGHNNTMKAYEEAIRQKYRFFSFGDAMLIL